MENLPEVGTLDAETMSSWSYDMEGQGSDFAGDLEDSKSTSVGLVFWKVEHLYQ